MKLPVIALTLVFSVVCSAQSGGTHPRHASEGAGPRLVFDEVEVRPEVAVSKKAQFHTALVVRPRINIAASRNIELPVFQDDVVQTKQLPPEAERRNRRSVPVLEFPLDLSEAVVLDAPPPHAPQKKAPN